MSDIDPSLSPSVPGRRVPETKFRPVPDLSRRDPRVQPDRSLFFTFLYCLEKTSGTYLVSIDSDSCCTDPFSLLSPGHTRGFSRPVTVRPTDIHSSHDLEGPDRK